MSRVTQKTRAPKPELAFTTAPKGAGAKQVRHPHGRRLAPGDPMLEREADAYAGGASLAPGVAPQSRRAGGEALPDPLRALHEARLGRPLGDLRVHRDGPAAAEAADLGAAAFAEAGDLVFAAGRYRPDRPDGQALIAHEVAHAAQQADGRGRGPALKEDLTLRPDIPPPRVMTQEGGQVVASVFFGQGEFLLGPRGVKALDHVRKRLAGMVAGATVIVEAHASGEGAESFNQALSEYRLSAVRGLLGPALGAHIDVTAKAYGEDQAGVTEAEAKGSDLSRRRALNRRVDIVILPKWSISPDPAPGAETPPPVIDLNPRNLDPRIFAPGADDPPLGPRAQRRPDLTRPVPEIKGPEPFSVCGVWKESTKEWFDRGLKRVGVGEKWRGILSGLGVGAVEGLTFKAIEAGIGEAGASKRDQKMIMSVFKGACKQEIK